MPSIGLKKTYNSTFIFLFCFGVSANELTLFFINAYNLFDHYHDKGKQDYTYLPKDSFHKKKCASIHPHFRRACFRKNWTASKVNKKIKNLCSLIKSSKAAIVGLVEVENQSVLEKLKNGCGYDYSFITKGDDKRGIDQALMVRNQKKLKIVSSAEIPVVGYRSVLKVNLNFKNKKLSVFVTHWPSQRGPVQKRIQMAENLMKILNNEKSFVVMGDFNISAEEESIIKNIWPYKNLIKEETYFYSRLMKWNSFDRFYIDKTFTKNFKILDAHVLKNRKLMNVFEYNDPKKAFFGSRIVGIPNKKYSDHFPIILKIRDK